MAAAKSRSPMSPRVRVGLRVVANVLITTGCALIVFGAVALDVIPNGIVAADRRAGRPVDRSEVELVWLSRGVSAGWSGLALLAMGCTAHLFVMRHPETYDR